MNLNALIQMLTGDKGRDKGRAVVLALCIFVAWKMQKLDELAVRIAVIETRLTQQFASSHQTTASNERP